MLSQVFENLVAEGGKKAILGNILKIFFGTFLPVLGLLKPTIYGGQEAQILTRVGADFGPVQALAG